MNEILRASTADLGHSRVAQIFIRAGDLDRAVAFYRDVLGFKFLFTAPPQMAFFDSGGVRLLVGVPEDAAFDHPSSIVYFDVPDIATVHQTLEERGVAFVAAPHVVHRGEGFELWLAEFLDSEGNTMALMSTVRV